MEPQSSSPRIVLGFSPEDLAWIRREAVEVPRFFAGHRVAPATGDVLRVGGRQFLIKGRLWEQEGAEIVLRLVLSSAYAQSDTVFGENLG
ncbi:MAG: hypothetical protein RLZZ584_3327 [Pseudomonadota bacterium]|jgi:hypothetical protein